MQEHLRPRWRRAGVFDQGIYAGRAVDLFIHLYFRCLVKSFMFVVIKAKAPKRLFQTALSVQLDVH